jgi:hypothetical protein
MFPKIKKIAIIKTKGGVTGTGPKVEKIVMIAKRC